MSPDEFDEALRCARSHLIKGTLLGDAETRLLARALLGVADSSLSLSGAVSELLARLEREAQP